MYTPRSIIRQFATATRNYAKRQLQWYRKDNSFLWLKIDRKNVEKDDMVPYNRVCEEIKHWCGMSTPDFNVAIQQQVQRGLAVTAARNRKKSGHKPKLTQPLDALVYENVSTSVDIVTPFSLKNYADKYTSLSTDLLSNEVVVNGSEIASKSIWNSSQSHSVSQIDEVAVEVEYKLSKQEQEALLHLGNSKRGDEDLSAYLPIMEWSAEGR